jgi:hypothetical protein
MYKLFNSRSLEAPNADAVSHRNQKSKMQCYMIHANISGWKSQKIGKALVGIWRFT